ncbi:MAG: NAD+ synthase [Synechococcales bacterium]|nr:NAD+ synthase [Synechococcales bacterium]
MKIAIAQLNPTIGDLAGNAQQILAAAQQAAHQGADLMLTPELSIAGYPPRDLLMQPSFVTSMAETVAQLAQDLPPHLAVLVGTAERNPQAQATGGKPLFNSIVLLHEGEVRQRFHKRLLPTYDVFDDHRYFEPDSQSNFFVLNGIRIGVTICEDLWNDEEFWGKRQYQANPLNDLSEQRVDLIVNLSGSPYSFKKQHLREAMLQHAARRYGLPILYVNQVGGNDDLIFDGNSVGFSRQGTRTCRAKGFLSDLLVTDFDDVAKDLVPCTVAPGPICDEAELWSALVLGLRDYARKCRFTDVVMGLSGGIDSSLVAAIATAALGNDHVLGVLMPSPYSSDSSISDAQDLVHNLGIKSEMLPIDKLMQGYDQTFEQLFAGTEFGVAEENIQSRIRGNLLMAVSNKFGHLLLSTGNKSEVAVGYCTLYGDMNGGLSVISDLPKTRVYAICRWLNEITAKPGKMAAVMDEAFVLRSPTPPPIPENILRKPPSAELKPGQTDQDSLPSYDVLDDILERLILQHQAPVDIVAAGHDAAVVKKVVHLVNRAEFKRRQAPPGLKVTDRAFGTGWRMPIASRWAAPTVAQLEEQTAPA